MLQSRRKLDCDWATDKHSTDLDMTQPQFVTHLLRKK